MKIAKHICFYFNQNRIDYINRILYETNKYSHHTDIFIHTNYNFLKDILFNYTNGIIEIVYHDLTNNLSFLKNPYCFPFFSRELMQQQKNDYDVFMYIEDDILVPQKALEYWIKYKDTLLQNNYNLGFFRIEIDDKGDEYTTDNSESPDGRVNQYLNKTLQINNEKYIINDANAYCAFWIYDKEEFNKYVNHYCWNINDFTRETMAFGLNNPNIQCKWYKATLVPLKNNKLHDDCRIYHMPNNYVHKKYGWKLHLFNEVCKL